MSHFVCPRCGEKTISLKDKFRAGKWLKIKCSNCGGDLCAQPLVLAVLYFALTWDIVLFGFLTIYDKNWVYGLTMIIGWLIIEYFISYVPLSKLKSVSKD